jgi:hypothetical protein
VDDLFKITVTHTSIFHFHTDNNKQFCSLIATKP